MRCVVKNLFNELVRRGGKAYPYAMSICGETREAYTYRLEHHAPFLLHLVRNESRIVAAGRRGGVLVTESVPPFVCVVAAYRAVVNRHRYFPSEPAFEDGTHQFYDAASAADWVAAYLCDPVELAAGLVLVRSEA